MIVTSVAKARRTRRVENLITEGHTTSGDGGHGSWYWDPTSTETDNVGTILKPQGWTGQGRYKRLFSGDVNVKWFGAKGDDTTEDGPAFRAAVECAATYTPVRGVFAPSGTYLLAYAGAASTGANGNFTDPTGYPAFSGRSSIFLLSGATLRGEGDTTILHWAGGGPAPQPDYDALLQWVGHDNGTYLVMQHNCIVCKGDDISVRDLKILGDNDTDFDTVRALSYTPSECYQRAAINTWHSSGQAIHVYNNWTIDNVTFDGLHGFIFHDPAEGLVGLKMSRIRAIDCGNGINPGGPECTFTDNDIYNAEGYEIAGNDIKMTNIRIAGYSSTLSLNAAGALQSRIVMNNITVDMTECGPFSLGGADLGVSFNNCRDVILTDVNIINPRTSGVQLFNGCSRATLTNITVSFDAGAGHRTGSTAGVVLISCSYVTVNNIQTSGDMLYGILILGTTTSRININGGMCTGHLNTGFNAEQGGADLSVVGLRCTSNTAYGMNFQDFSAINVHSCVSRGNATDIHFDGLCTDIRMTGNEYGNRIVTAPASIAVAYDIANGP